MPRDACDGGLRCLQERLLELERERFEARERADVLAGLHGAFRELAVTRDPSEIVARTLRAAADPLGFSRAIFFSADPAGGFTLAQFLDEFGDPVPAGDEHAALRSGDALATVAFGESDFEVGTGTELGAPLVDCRGWFAAARVAHAGRTSGVLYADGHHQASPTTPEAALLRTLAAIAAVALDNSALFARIQSLAERDPLTGLFNRRAFAARVASELERCKREAGAVAYALIDVDDFKTVNDAKGHAFGDAVLQRVASTLSNCSRPQDVVGRFAGDEFVVLFTGIDVRLARALVRRLSSELRVRGLRCSIGVALYPDDAADEAALFAAADRALYATKAAGKNGFTFA